MTLPDHNPTPLDELQFALAEADAEDPPADLGTSVLGRALAARRPGAPVHEAQVITPLEAFGRTTRALEALLGDLDHDAWRRATIRGLTVQGLVGHLIGVEHAFVAGVDDPDGAQRIADHVTSTDPVVRAQEGRPPAETLEDWRRARDRSLAHVGALPADPDPMTRVATLHGLRMPLGDLLVARSFELWTHAEDVRRATGRAPEDPDGATLRRMTDLAVVLLPLAMGRPGTPTARRSVRVVLTGPGGGAWQLGGDTGARAGAADHAPAYDARVVMDAVVFCRLIANRVDPDLVEASIRGSDEVARAVFRTAAALALD